MTRAEQASANFRAGCNCAQAVLLAFSDQTGLTREQSLRVASPFGGGLCGLRETCGAASGLLLAYGLIRGYDDIESHDVKKAVYASGRALLESLRAAHGTLCCRDLLGELANTPVPAVRTDAYYASRPCEKLVMDAASILEEAIGG